MKNIKDDKIIDCTFCNGLGYNPIEGDIRTHFEDYNETCYFCSSAGRILESELKEILDFFDNKKVKG